jgi:hypothetical protein
MLHTYATYVSLCLERSAADDTITTGLATLHRPKLHPFTTPLHEQGSINRLRCESHRYDVYVMNNIVYILIE